MSHARSGAPADFMAEACGRLADRGIDPEQVLGKGEYGETVTTASLYVTLGVIAASEKAGQSPTYALARLAPQAGLPSDVVDSLFLAYNQQSAEEASHGDKVFGNAYYALGGRAPSAAMSAFGQHATPAGPSEFLVASDDPKENKKRLGAAAGVLGGIETVALQRIFPNIVRLCEAWDHPIARDLVAQIEGQVRPEESRHVLLFRYVFHKLIADKGAAVIESFRSATNAGRAQVGAGGLDAEAFKRLVGSSCPTQRQLLGKDRVAFA